MKSREGNFRQYWLWVTRPKYYLDEEGNELEDLDPAHTEDAGGWWTCHKDTKKGDLVLLWRSYIKKDIGYLIQVESDAYSIRDDNYANEQGWDYGCDYRVLYKFSPSIGIRVLKNEPTLSEWTPLRFNFQRRAFPIAPADWLKLNRLIIQSQPTYEQFITQVEQEPILQKIVVEEQIEERLVNQLSLLKPFGYNLDLYDDPITGLSGRQYVCKGNGGRMDLFCYDENDHKYVVIELKNVRAGLNTFGQICNYIGWVQNNIANNIPVVGLVISRGYDVKFESALKVTPNITQLNIEDIGFA